MWLESKKNNILNAAKWSSFSELFAKLIGPLTNMALARLISPEAFGIIATITMITSFAEMFTESGFQKYLIQHQFENEDDFNTSINVAFWTNLSISLILWMIIILFKTNIANFVGINGYGGVIAFACIQLPITAFSSTQTAIFRKKFDFKTLFLIRILTSIVPLIVTIPLAFNGLGHWAVILGTLASQISSACILTFKSNYKPKLEYDFNQLKKMFNFSSWSLLESISIWLIAWIDSLIIGQQLSQYYLGIYKNSTSLVNSIMALITASVLPVLYSTLSKFQNDKEKSEQYFLNFQKAVSTIVFPLGIGMYVYRDLVTSILLGNDWKEATDVIGIWALSSSFVIVLSLLNSELYRAKGKPNLSFVSKILHLVVLVPTIIYFSNQGFMELVYARSFIRIHEIIISFIFLSYFMKITSKAVIKNILPSLLSAITMGIFALTFRANIQGNYTDIISILLCVIIYFMLLLSFKSSRNDIFSYLMSKKVTN